jgi:hypothetical protein
VPDTVTLAIVDVILPGSMFPDIEVAVAVATVDSVNVAVPVIAVVVGIAAAGGRLVAPGTTAEMVILASRQSSWPNVSAPGEKNGQLLVHGTDQRVG